MTYNFKWEIE